MCHSSFERETVWEGSSTEGMVMEGTEEREEEVMRRVEGAREGGRERGEAAGKERESQLVFLWKTEKAAKPARGDRAGRAGLACARSARLTELSRHPAEEE